MLAIFKTYMPECQAEIELVTLQRAGEASVKYFLLAHILQRSKQASDVLQLEWGAGPRQSSPCSPCHSPVWPQGVQHGLESAGLAAMTASGVPRLRDHMMRTDWVHSSALWGPEDIDAWHVGWWLVVPRCPEETLGFIIVI